MSTTPHGPRPRPPRPLFAALAILLACAHAPAQVLLKELPEELQGVDIQERLGNLIPLDTPIVDSRGRTAPLGAYFNQGKPVILLLAYYDCPLACPAVLTKMLEAVNGLDYTVGTDFNVVVVSFDHTNTTEMAAENEALYLAGYDRSGPPEVAAGWRFHTARAASARAIADAVGFQYRYLPEVNEYSHPTGFFVLTPAGAVSRVFFGFSYPARDLKLALLEASEGKIARSFGDKLLLFCFHYDPTRGSYSLAAFRVMQIGGALTALLVGLLLVAMKVIERTRRAGRVRRAARAPARPSGAPSHRGLALGSQT